MAGTTSARDAHASWRGPVAAGALGIALGSLGRGLPVTLAGLVDRDRAAPPCDDQAAIVECAFAAVPAFIEWSIMFGFLVLLFAGLLTVGGVVLLTVGLINRGVREDAASKSQFTLDRFLLVMLGSSLLMPAVWLVAAFAVSR